MRKDLVPGEQVVVATRPQPRKLAGPAAAFVAAPAAAAFASAWLLRGEATRQVPFMASGLEPWLVLGCVAAAGWIWLAYCLPRLLRWQGTRYILTSRRVVARYGLMRRRDIQVNLAAIRSVLLRQTAAQRILRSGNISLETGYQNLVVLQDVPEAARFRNFVLDAMDELPAVGNPQGRGAWDDTDEALMWESREGGDDE